MGMTATFNVPIHSGRTEEGTIYFGGATASPDTYNLEIDVSGWTEPTFTLTGNFNIGDGTNDSTITFNLTQSWATLTLPPDHAQLAEFTDLGNGEFSITYFLDELFPVLGTTFTDLIGVNDTAPGSRDPMDQVNVIFFCFAKGTGIATPHGMVPVETLVPGSLVTTMEGRFVPVRFNFRQTIAMRFGMAERLQPVRVRAGALGSGLPERDLTLTADHALMIDGLLVNAGALVNGAGIDWVPVAELGARFTVYHIETEDHDIILAEGMPAETYIDYAGRRAFDNYAEYTALYGEDRAFAENPAPRITSARMLPPSLRARLGICRAA